MLGDSWFGTWPWFLLRWDILHSGPEHHFVPMRTKITIMIVNKAKAQPMTVGIIMGKNKILGYGPPMVLWKSSPPSWREPQSLKFWTISAYLPGRRNDHLRRFRVFSIPADFNSSFSDLFLIELIITLGSLSHRMKGKNAFNCQDFYCAFTQYQMLFLIVEQHICLNIRFAYNEL